MQSTLSMDLVEELRLRRWAREHYVSPSQRDTDWHSVVHEEMARKEQDLLAERVDPIGSRYVPLPVESPSLHASHELSPPRFLASPQHAEELYYT